jgi:hypothetical protein
MSDLCRKVYWDYNSYLKSRDIDRQVCNLKEFVDEGNLSEGGTINGTLDMCCNIIQNVLGMKFCDDTFIGNTSGIFEISGNITFTNDISINGTIYHSNNFVPPIGGGGDVSGSLADVLLNGNQASINIDMCCNSIIDISNLFFCNGTNYTSTIIRIDNSLNNHETRIEEKYDKSGGLINGNVEIAGNLDLSCNLINDVSGIYFCDGTYIGHGSSFDISTNEILKINDKMMVIDNSGFIGINLSNPSNRLDISDGDLNITNGRFKINNNDRAISYLKTETGFIYLGSSNNERFGEPSFNLIFSSGSPNDNGLAIGTFNANEDLILGVDNKQIIRIDASNDVINMFRDVDMSNNDIYEVNNIRFSNNNGVRIGLNAGQTDQSLNSIAIGTNAGNDNQDQTAIAIGSSAGIQNQNVGGIAIGRDSGRTDQGSDSISIGVLAGQTSQGINSVSIGRNAGRSSQSVNAVAIGRDSGRNNQGTSAVSIGSFAGVNNQPNNSIIINATGSIYDVSNTNAFYVNPVRGEVNLVGKKIMYYDVSSGEITYTQDGSIDLSCGIMNDVSGIYFCDGTYIGHGSSFDISTNEEFKLIQNGTENFKVDLSGNFTFNQNNTLSFQDISSVSQNVQLPTIHQQPVSLQRISIFRNDNSFNIPSDTSKLINFNETIVNQLNLGITGVSNELISPSPDISGQMVEIYLNVLVDPDSNNSYLQFDISSVMGTSFLEEISSRELRNRNRNYYITLGPHIFIPDEWSGSQQFVFKLTADGGDILVLEEKIVFKSYFV